MTTTLPRPTGERVCKVIATPNPPLMFPDIIWSQEEKFRYLADLIESLPAKHFNLEEWFHIPYGMTVGAHGSEPVRLQEMPVAELVHLCGTSACIAGWIVADQIHPAFTLPHDGDAQGFGQRWLELSYDEAMHLFTDRDWWAHAVGVRSFDTLGDITQTQAVEVLQGLADGDIEL